jgi:DNA-binding transcriptional LysR family regulator
VSLSLARRNLGIAIVEPLTAIGLPLEGVKVIPLSFSIPFRWSVITAIGRPISSATEVIIEALRETAEAEVPRLVTLT